MTQDGQFNAEANPFAAAEQVSATLGTLTDALFDEHTSRHPASSLSALRSGPASQHPAAEALFGLPLAPNGPVHAAVDRLGTVITAGTARPGTGAPRADRAAAALLARYGGGSVRGAIADRGTTSAALFQLPVSGEIADPKLRPPFAPALAALAGGQQTLQPVELATGSGTEVRLVVPPGFHPFTSPGGPAGVSARTVPPLPAGADGADPAAVAAADELTRHLAEVAEELFSATGPTPRRDFAVIAATLADLVHASGTVYAGVCALEADGRATEATLVVSLTRHPLPITALATELATVRRHAEVWTVLLPAGPAAVLVEGRTVPVPGALAADGQRRWVVTSVVQAFVPLPDGVSVLCVQLSTAQPEDWELYTEAFAELLKSVQFGWDGVAGVPAPVSPPAQAHAPTPTPAPVAEQVQEEAPEEAPVHLRGTPVRVPPADFNPFAPLADAPPAEDQEPALRGTPVMIPPPDFNPFAPESLPALPDDASTAPAGAPDPFGTATPADQPSDPFGTTLASQGPAIPPPPSVPPRIPAPADPAPEEPPLLKGTPVMIPPPDFNPFAPESLPALPDEAPAADAPAAAGAETSPFG
ncbi:hypothetical protein F7Q99_24135 [Streptomyces kaniharaensis]|uniref:Uncharacterized protein n=1 Tax=Streptomyces kaniharaensis TaxID=212423 RepID=A0A6N7L0E9_9ACTN|nr:hypothetical protein [Streptomyces kaniharaensis]MQS15273.1 hypothetical protein [Streptomyces kaniharaensis]